MAWLRMQWQLQGRSGKPTTGSDNSNFTWEVEHASPALCQHSRDRPVDLTLRLGVCPLVKVVAAAMSGSPCHCRRFMKTIACLAFCCLCTSMYSPPLPPN